VRLVTRDVPARVLRGRATWYGPRFHGHRTASGETFDAHALTAAHRWLPFGTRLRVCRGTRCVVVRVNDRGPFLHGRIVDLSYAAAHKLGIAQRGSGEVVVESLLAGGETVASVAPVLATPVPVAAGKPGPADAPVQSAAGGFVVQLGAFASEPNARSFLSHVQERLAASADIAPRVREAGGLYRVYVGPYPSRDDARRSAERLASAFGLATAVAPH